MTKIWEVNAKLSQLCKELSVAQLNVPQKCHAVKSVLENCAPNTDLGPFLSLCVSRSDQVRALGLKMVKEIPAHFHETVVSFAVDSLAKSSKSGNAANEVSRTALFYRIFTFEECYIQFLVPYFLECSQAMKSDVLVQMTRILEVEQIGPELVKLCLSKSLALDLLSFILTQQALVTNLSPEICDILNSEYDKQKDAKFLIPTVPTMGQQEFLQNFNVFLSIPDVSVLRTFAFEFLYAKSRPIEIYEFLAELHRYTDKEDTKYRNSVLLFNFCAEQKQIVTVRELCSGIDRAAKTQPLNMLFGSIQKVMNMYQMSEKVIAKRVLETIIARDLDSMPECWEELKKLICEVAPDCCGCALKLPFDLFEDLIKSSPDLKEYFLDWLKKNGNDGISEEFIRIINLDSA
jgi:hypothetical protein